MEALLFLAYGFLLMYPVIQLARKGSHVLLSVKVVPYLVIAVFIFPILPYAYKVINAGAVLPQHILLDVARDYCWVAGSILVLIFSASAFVQFFRDSGQGRRDKWTILDARAEVAVSAGNYENALNLYEEALRIDPYNFRGHFKFARLLNRVGFKKRAFDHLMLSIEHCPPEDRKTLCKACIQVLSSSQQAAGLAEQFEYQCRRRFQIEF